MITALSAVVRGSFGTCRPSRVNRSHAAIIRKPLCAPRSLARVTRVGGNRCVTVQSTSQGEGGSPSLSAVGAVRKELAELEKERDAAVETAESCAQTSVKVTEMVGLLELMAIEKLRKGDEEGAKLSLREKAAAKEVVERSKTKAELHYALAARLATKIGERQNALLTLLRGSPSAPSSPAPQPPPAQPSTPSYYPPIPSYSAPPSTPSGYSSPSPSMPSSTWSSVSSESPRSAPADYGSYSADTYAPSKPKWQTDMDDNLKRIEKKAEYRARAAKLSAEDNINQARERLKEKGYPQEDILQARDRLKKKDVNSITEAQQRLRQQDAEVLAYVRSIMARYKKGEYVSEDELEFAFRQLETRFS